MSNNLIPAYTYSDVLISPRYSEVESRSDVSLCVNIGDLKLKLPVITSNMRNVTGGRMASTVAEKGCVGLLHRFCSIDENVKMYTDACKGVHLNGFIGVSIGVKEEDRERFTKLYNVGARLFCIDVAHGHHINVKSMMQWITKQNIKDITLIVGNVATYEGYCDLVSWGANAVKVGIGPSPVCRTRYNTGVGVPQLHALQEAYRGSLSLHYPVSIIADGGISCVGDIAKALKYADAVMIGSMISGCSETPGHVFRNENGEFYKTYGGSASGENKGENRFVEGVIKTVPFKGKVKYILREIEQGLQSAYSYVGAASHSDFQNKCEFTYISNGSHNESRM